MIVIVLAFALLCIVMSCVALWYRVKWNESEDKCRALERENRELSTGQRITISDNANMLANNINLQNELIALRGKYEQSEFQCDILRKESDDKSKRIVSLLDENNKLRSNSPSEIARVGFVRERRKDD